MHAHCKTKGNDWVANKSQFILAWGLPATVMIVAWLIAASTIVTGVIWMTSLLWMGIACLNNARHCGRMHCYFSGPFFLCTGLVALGIGLNGALFKLFSLNGLGLFLLIGAPLVSVLPEVFWGTYKRQIKEENECHD